MGDGSLPSAGVWASLRLFVSPVKPSLTQAGADLLVAVKAVCASSVVLLPKIAALPLPSPNTPHSVVFQNLARWILLSLLLTAVADPPTDNDTLSLPPEAALPESLRVASCLAVSGLRVLALLLVKQSLEKVFQPAGHVAL